MSRPPISFEELLQRLERHTHNLNTLTDEARRCLRADRIAGAGWRPDRRAGPSLAGSVTATPNRIGWRRLGVEPVHIADPIPGVRALDPEQTLDPGSSTPETTDGTPPPGDRGSPSVDVDTLTLEKHFGARLEEALERATRAETRVEDAVAAAEDAQATAAQATVAAARAESKAEQAIASSEAAAGLARAGRTEGREADERLLGLIQVVANNLDRTDQRHQEAQAEQVARLALLEEQHLQATAIFTDAVVSLTGAITAGQTHADAPAPAPAIRPTPVSDAAPAPVSATRPGHRAAPDGAPAPLSATRPGHRAAPDATPAAAPVPATRPGRRAAPAAAASHAAVEDVPERAADSFFAALDSGGLGGYTRPPVSAVVTDAVDPGWEDDYDLDDDEVVRQWRRQHGRRLGGFAAVLAALVTLFVGLWWIAPEEPEPTAEEAVTPAPWQTPEEPTSAPLMQAHAEDPEPATPARTVTKKPQRQQRVEKKPDGWDGPGGGGGTLDEKLRAGVGDGLGGDSGELELAPGPRRPELPNLDKGRGPGSSGITLPDNMEILSSASVGGLPPLPPLHVAMTGFVSELNRQEKWHRTKLRRCTRERGTVYFEIVRGRAVGVRAIAGFGSAQDRACIERVVREHFQFEPYSEPFEMGEVQLSL